MPSPFPGMDPYLEGTLWPDVHGSLIYTIRAAIAARLPAGYFANIDQYLWLREEDDDEKSTRRGKPDTFVTNGTSEKRGPATGSSKPGTPAPSAVAEPTVRLPVPAPKRAKKKYIRLIDTNDQSIVTVIELLSPSDKLPKEDRRRYLTKRNEYLAARVNLVEIDLLRKGQRVPTGKQDPPEADYYVMVSRAADPVIDVWAFTVRDPIPVFPVPLKPDAPEIPLDLRACLDRAYEEARYEQRIDYTRPADPALRKPDADWAAEMLKTSKK